jgi:hypothetical protein
LYLAHAEEHPNGSDPFGTIIISDGDMSHWQHRVSSPTREFPLKNVRITGINDKFVCVATEIDNGEKLIALTSENGFDWVQQFASVTDLNRYSTIVRTVGGGVVSCCNSGVLFTSNLTDWKFSKFTDKYWKYTAIDVTHHQTEFFIILEYDGSYAIAYTRDFTEYSYYDLEWGKRKPTSISSNGSQMVITCNESLAERCSFYYTDNGKENKWMRFEIKPPYRTISNSLSEICSVASDGNQWVFVGRIREYNNTRSMLFSYKALVYRIEGIINSKSTLIQDNIDSLDLNYVQHMNGKFHAFGKNHPVGESRIYTLE